MVGVEAIEAPLLDATDQRVRRLLVAGHLAGVCVLGEPACAQ